MGEIGLTLADVVRLLRDRKGWTQEQLADAAGVDRTVVVRFENGGDTKRTTVDKIAKGLGHTTADLYAALPLAMTPRVRRALDLFRALVGDQAQDKALLILQEQVDGQRASDEVG